MRRRSFLGILVASLVGLSGCWREPYPHRWRSGLDKSGETEPLVYLNRLWAEVVSEDEGVEALDGARLDWSEVFAFEMRCDGLGWMAKESGLRRGSDQMVEAYVEISKEQLYNWSEGELRRHLRIIRAEMRRALNTLARSGTACAMMRFWGSGEWGVFLENRAEERVLRAEMRRAVREMEFRPPLQEPAGNTWWMTKRG